MHPFHGLRRHGVALRANLREFRCAQFAHHITIRIRLHLLWRWCSDRVLEVQLQCLAEIRDRFRARFALACHLHPPRSGDEPLAVAPDIRLDLTLGYLHRHPPRVVNRGFSLHHRSLPSSAGGPAPASLTHHTRNDDREHPPGLLTVTYPEHDPQDRSGSHITSRLSPPSDAGNGNGLPTPSRRPKRSVNEASGRAEMSTQGNVDQPGTLPADRHAGYWIISPPSMTMVAPVV